MLWNACPILEYHNIAPDGEGADFAQSSVTPEAFSQQIETLQAAGFVAVTLAEAFQPGARLPRKPVVFSFDDGYLDTVENAFPALARAGWKATVFCAPGLMDGSVNRTDHCFGGVRLMNFAQMRQLADAGWEIAGHTDTHPELPSLSVEEQRREILGGKQALERILGREVVSFAYPRGMYTPDTVRLVKECGFRCAVTVKKGNRHFPSERFLLPRVFMRSTTVGNKLLHKLGILSELGNRVRRVREVLRAGRG